MQDSDRLSLILQLLSRGFARVARDCARVGEVTPQQAETLHLVAERGSISTSSLASALGIDPSTASRNLAGLERVGLVIRKKSIGDGRQTDIRLTPHGRKVIDKIRGEADRSFADVMEQIPRADRTKVADALAILAKTIETKAS